MMLHFKNEFLLGMSSALNYFIPIEGSLPSPWLPGCLRLYFLQLNFNFFSDVDFFVILKFCHPENFVTSGKKEIYARNVMVSTFKI